MNRKAPAPDGTNRIGQLLSGASALRALVMSGLLAAVAAPAFAQDVPSYAQPIASGDETVQGRIASIDAKYAITVNDSRGFVDNVSLHDGTIINPTGLTLTPGMSVTIAGYNAGNVFVANQIDTPYTYDGPPPVAVYYGPGAWYPGYAYGYGPSYSLFIGFGGSYAAIRRPWYGYWYVHPYVQPWVGYRAPYPIPFGAYRNVAIVHTNVQENVRGYDTVPVNRFTESSPRTGSYGQGPAPGYARGMRSGSTQSYARSQVYAGGMRSSAGAPRYGNGPPHSGGGAPSRGAHGGGEGHR